VKKAIGGKMSIASDDRFSFRAWHKEWDEMVYSMAEYPNYFKRQFYPWGFETGNSGYPESGWIIMQSMDRRDKYGVLIYDGDIVNLKMEFREYEDAEPEYRILTGQIIFQGGGFWFTGTGWSINNLHFYNDSDLEVIGNIYENPEKLVDSRKKIRGMNDLEVI
jgi:hypothetical protein